MGLIFTVYCLGSPIIQHGFSNGFPRYASGHRLLPLRGQLRGPGAQRHQRPEAARTAGHRVAHPGSAGDISAGGRWDDGMGMGFHGGFMVISW